MVHIAPTAVRELEFPNYATQFAASTASQYEVGLGTVRLTSERLELSVGPFFVTRSNPTQPTESGKIWTQPDPTQYN